MISIGKVCLENFTEHRELKALNKQPLIQLDDKRDKCKLAIKAIFDVIDREASYHRNFEYKGNLRVA